MTYGIRLKNESIHPTTQRNLSRPPVGSKNVDQSRHGVNYLYFLVAFVLGASFIYPGLNKAVLTKEPVEVFNSVLLYFFFFELVLRFFLQQLPVTNIQNLILLPIKKNKIINHVLFRSAFSGFNLFPFIIYLPFAISMYRDDYLAVQVFAWWSSLLLVTLSINFLIYILNKDNRVFFVLLGLMALVIFLESLAFFDTGAHLGKAFDLVVENPSVFGLFFLPAITSYAAGYYFLKRGFYMDAGLKQKKGKVRGGEFAFLNVFGENALFLKNDLRMIIRNVRPRQIVVMSFLFLFYGASLFPSRDLPQPALYFGLCRLVRDRWLYLDVWELCSCLGQQLL